MITDRNVKVDIVVNYVSFFIIATAGIFLNFVLAKLYDPDAFGVFNQSYAVYIIFSQLSVLGVHHSAQKHISHNFKDSNTNFHIALSAILITSFLSVVSFVFLLCVRDYIGVLLGSPNTSKSLLYVAYALLFFGINKVFLSTLNGLHKMISFAVFQASRYVLIILVVFVLYYNHVPSYCLTFSFLLSEVLLLLALSLYFLFIKRLHISIDYGLTRSWIKKHLLFGIKGAMSAVLVEFNTRVDVIILGIFTTDKNVGVYSLAACFAEGFYQLLMVIKNYINPLISNLYFRKDLSSFIALRKRVVKYCYLGSLGLYILAIPIISVFISVILKLNPIYFQTPVLFAIIALGVVISAGVIPFNDILLQTGHPGHHSFSVIFTVISNIVLCFILVPLLGLYGASIAMAISLIFNVVIVDYYINKLESIRLVSFFKKSN